MNKSRNPLKENLSQKRNIFVNFHNLFILFFIFTIISSLIYIVLVKNHNTLCTRISAPYLFGTLETDPTKASQECAAGVRVAMQTIGWKDYEQLDGVFNEVYMNDV